MNPSAPGWITKFGHLVQQANVRYTDYGMLYDQLKDNGFVYGIHLAPPPFIETDHSLSEDEIAKINLLTALYFSFILETKNIDFKEFTTIVFNYYKNLEIGKVSFLGKILSGNKTESQLEKLLDSRIYLDDNALNRALSGGAANFLLFVDVLTFAHYLKEGSEAMEHARMLEYVAINIANHALDSKEMEKKDERLIHLLDASLTYATVDDQAFDGSYRDLLKGDLTALERQYFLDIACLTVWEDQSLELTESDFLHGIGKDLGKDAATIDKSITDVQRFFAENRDKASFLKDSNLALQFYDGMSKNVGKLILRNSKRLQKELSESAELVALLSKSTYKTLSAEERKKVKMQLLDIFKSIPSLAIFLLPGGAVLLPIFIKLIPKLLPSSFDENRVEDA